jgi:serine/threonine-protein kinase RsbW
MVEHDPGGKEGGPGRRTKAYPPHPSAPDEWDRGLRGKAMAHETRTSQQETDVSTEADVMLTPDLVLTLPARAENVAVVRHAFGGLGDALDIEDQVLADVKLAVTEACTNVVVHAYPDGDGPMEVAAGVRDGRLTIAVRDEGRGMLPRPDSPGLGLGLPLIATLAETLELGRSEDKRTEVRMTFNIELTEEEL